MDATQNQKVKFQTRYPKHTYFFHLASAIATGSTTYSGIESVDGDAIVDVTQNQNVRYLFT